MHLRNILSNDLNNNMIKTEGAKFAMDFIDAANIIQGSNSGSKENPPGANELVVEGSTTKK